MTDIITDDIHYKDIGNAIREKNFKTDLYLPSQMAQAIRDIKITGKLQVKNVTPTKAKQNITADEGFSALGRVDVEPIPAEFITTTDATATETDILQGKTAYVNGVKVTGNYVPADFPDGDIVRYGTI